MKLFAILIGGSHPRAHIELHDMRFVAARSIEETHEEVRRQWWGTPASLHLDGWAELDHVDGYDVTLRPERFDGDERLYYVNLGGYEPGVLLEQHRSVFVVATSAADAKTRALRANKGLKGLHRDGLYEAEEAFALDALLYEQRLHIHLTPSASPRALQVTCKYVPLRKRTRRLADS